MIPLGRRRPTGELVELLAECHERIRRFTALAVRLGREPATPAERAEAAAAVARYLGHALPLHVADEEQSVAPRMRGRDPAIDAALRRMADEHARDDAGRAELVALGEALAADPARWDELAARWRALAVALERDLLAHVEEEERAILPAIERLIPADERARVVAEMRARRAAARD